MAEFPYTTVLGKLKQFLGKIREVGVPKRATHKWLESLRFRSKNDRSILTVMKFIGFINDSGIPTDFWNQYRGGRHKVVLAEAIVHGYSELYSTYPDAHNRSSNELESFFSTRTTAGK
jgi:hypothetical protein